MMTSSSMTKPVIYFNAVIAVLFFSWVLRDNWNFFFPIHTIHSIMVLTPVVTVGEPVSIQITASRRRICKPHTVRFFRDVAANKIVKISEGPGGSSGLGKHNTTTVQILEAKDLKPGNYHVSGYITNDCGGFVSTVQMIPFDFKITSK